MSTRTLSPTSVTSSITLPASGSFIGQAAGGTQVIDGVVYGMYTGSVDFVTGAQDQVGYVFKKLGGDILDLEITETQVYAAYEEAVLEYSYLVNLHQSKNSLGDLLGSKTGSFDSKGEYKGGVGSVSASLDHTKYGGGNVATKYPHLTFAYERKTGQALSNEVNLNGYETVYSASFNTVEGQQDYDLQSLIAADSAATASLPFYEKVGNNRLLIRKVYYKTPNAMWRFFGYYGGLNAVGNLQNYGQYADDSQFQIIPVWQNKQQAMSFEDAIYTRNSHFSYELKNNNLRIFPQAVASGPKKMWVEFVIANNKEPWEEDANRMNNVSGVNNMNTLPFKNIIYEHINSMGKQWIRRFALSVCKEMLGQVRSKFGTIPIPGNNLSLNGDALITQAKQEQEALRTELKQILDDTTYVKLAQENAAKTDSVLKVQEKMPLPIFQG
jgi:hypothetical protein|tara:strand:+ start:753 stop:2072 length:1320 start_codon:yes stop_codon:yes gene_type:complete